MRFRRRPEPALAEHDVEVSASEASAGPEAAPEPATVRGPRDFDEVAADAERGDRLDLGSLLINPGPGREVRVQVEESSQSVQSVLITGREGAVELRAFAAPRHGDLWAEVLPQLRSEMAQRGGTASERDGPWGRELYCEVPVQLPDGRAATRPSRMVGVNGPRWLLRATLLGRPAVGSDDAGDWDDVLDGVVVRRGAQAMPAGDPLPLTLPPQARRPG